MQRYDIILGQSAIAGLCHGQKGAVGSKKIFSFRPMHGQPFRGFPIMEIVVEEKQGWTCFRLYQFGTPLHGFEKGFLLFAGEHVNGTHHIGNDCIHFHGSDAATLGRTSHESIAVAVVVVAASGSCQWMICSSSIRIIICICVHQRWLQGGSTRHGHGGVVGGDGGATMISWFWFCCGWVMIAFASAKVHESRAKASPPKVRVGR